MEDSAKIPASRGSPQDTKARRTDDLEPKRRRPTSRRRADATTAAQTRVAQGELERRAAQLAALHATLLDITAEHDLPRLLHAIVERATRLLDGSSGGLYLCDTERQQVRCVVSYNTPRDYTGVVLKYGEGAAGKVAASGEPLIIEDYRTWPGRAAAFEEGEPFTAVISAPMNWQGQVTGVIHVMGNTQTRRFTPNDLELLGMFANQAAIAVENARLYEQAQQEITQRKQAEEALGRERNLLRTLLDNLPDCHIFVKDTHSRFITTNLSHLKTLGAQTLDEVIGKTDFDLFPPELAGQYYADEQAVVQSGQPLVNRVEPVVDREGRRKWYLTTKAPLCDASGDIVGLVGLSRDITDQVRAEEALRRRNRELGLLNRIIAATATEAAPLPILETACYELAQAFGVAQAAALLLNEARSQAVVVAEYLTDGRPSALGTSVPVTDDPLLQHLLTYKAPLVISTTHTDAHPHFAGAGALAGTHAPTLRQGTSCVLALPLVIGGEVAGSLELEAAEPRQFSTEEMTLAWSAADQVASGLARARLAESQRRLSAAIEQAAESIVIMDADGTILYVNPAFEHITGYSHAEAVGQTMDILRSGAHDDTFYERLWATIRAGQVWHGRIVNKRKDGSLYTDEASITPVRDELGAIVYYVEVKRDVTRELQLEEQYRQAQKMEAVGQLTAGIAHDFNNLLTAINGFAELMQFQLAPDDPLHDPLQKIIGSGQRAADLVRQLLAFSRKQLIQPQVLELNTVVADMEKMLKRVIGENIKLRTNLSPELWPIKADPSQIEQVIVNLAVNARDAMPQGGNLIIETANVVLDQAYVADHVSARPGDYVLLAVSDTGVGMSPEVKARIFEPFFTTKEAGKGTGLGLATVYGIVQQSEGSVWVYSEPGVGTTFKVYWPRSEETTPAVRRPASSQPLPVGNETILLVEDDAPVRELARLVLQRQGYTVLQAVDGQDALKLAASHTGAIHLLLSDVVMPGLSGVALAERLTQIRPGLKSLFMSGYTDEAIAHHGVLEPGIAFLQKPFSPMELARKVRQVLACPQPALAAAGTHQVEPGQAQLEASPGLSTPFL